MLECKFCKKECKSANSLRNHERLCPNNIDRNYVSQTTKEKGFSPWNKGLTTDSDIRVKQGAESLKESYVSGKINKRIWTDADRLAQSARCKTWGFGGYTKNGNRTKKFYVIDSFGNETCLQGTYEMRCSHILNNLGILWYRPKALKYNGRNYFADFYLPEYDIYLDPKNVYKAKLDSEKIASVIAENNVRVEILLDEQITEEYIKQLIKSPLIGKRP